MKQTIKISAAALAIASLATAFAQDVEETEVEETQAAVAVEQSESVGWTPIALGIATPIQLPWGWRKWDVFGLDLNLLYSDAPRVYGLEAGLVAVQTTEPSKGLFLSLACNAAREDVAGVRATIGVNYCGTDIKGVDIGGLGLRRGIYGVGLNLLGAIQKNMCGVEISGLGNFDSIESYGVSIAGVCNMARSASGLQMAIVYNGTDELSGCQIGLVNFADECVSGFQIGLINIILSNQVKVLPFVNGYF